MGAIKINIDRVEDEIPKLWKIQQQLTEVYNGLYWVKRSLGNEILNRKEIGTRLKNSIDTISNQRKKVEELIKFINILISEYENADKIISNLTKPDFDCKGANQNVRIFNNDSALDTNNGIIGLNFTNSMVKHMQYINELKEKRENGILTVEEEQELSNFEKAVDEAIKVKETKKDNNEEEVSWFKSIIGALGYGGVNALDGLVTASDAIGDFYRETIYENENVPKYFKVIFAIDPVLFPLNIQALITSRPEIDKIEEGLDDAKKTINEWSGYDKQGTVQRFVSDVVGSLPQMGLNFIPYVGTAVFAQSVAGNYIEQAKIEGATEGEALLYGIIGGLSEALFVKYLEIVPGYNSLFKEGAKLGLKGTAKLVLKQAAKEGLEEALTDPITGLAAKFIYDHDKKLFGEGGVIDIKQMIYDCLVGAVMGGTLSGISLTTGDIVGNKSKVQNGDGNSNKGSNIENVQVEDGSSSGEKVESVESNGDVDIEGVGEAEANVTLSLSTRFLNRSDKLFENAAHIKPIEGYQDIIIHGDKYSLVYKDLDGIESNVSVEEFAKILKDSPVYNGGPIRLISCETGAPDAITAQYLSKYLGVEVMAPTDIVWVYGDGEMIIGPDQYTNTGTWKVFMPEE